MPGVLTFTPNPCIDKIVSVPVLLPDKKLHCTIEMRHPGERSNRHRCKVANNHHQYLRDHDCLQKWRKNNFVASLVWVFLHTGSDSFLLWQLSVNFTVTMDLFEKYPSLQFT